MTVRFPLIRGLLVGLFAVYAGATTGGCADSSSKTDLPDIAAIVQVMVAQPDLAGSDYMTDPLSGFAITFERDSLNPIGGNNVAVSDYGNCYLFSGDPAVGQGSPSPECRKSDLNALCTCPDYVDGPLKCASDGPLVGRCVTSDGTFPEVRHGAAAAAQIRLVVGKLLDGATLEHF